MVDWRSFTNEFEMSHSPLINLIFFQILQFKWSWLWFSSLLIDYTYNLVMLYLFHLKYTSYIVSVCTFWCGVIVQVVSWLYVCTYIHQTSKWDERRSHEAVLSNVHYCYPCYAMTTTGKEKLAKMVIKCGRDHSHRLRRVFDPRLEILLSETLQPSTLILPLFESPI